MLKIVHFALMYALCSISHIKTPSLPQIKIFTGANNHSEVKVYLKIVTPSEARVI